MREAILASEIFGILVMFVILYGVGIESKQKTKKMRAFKILAIFILCTIFFDAILYLPIEWEGDVTFLKITSTFSITLPLVDFAVFLEYLYLYIAEKAAPPKFLFYIGIIYSIIGAATSIVMSVNGYLFTYENGICYEGRFYKEYLFTYLIVIVYTVVLTLCNAKYMGVHDSLAALSFVAIPVAFIVVNVLVDGLSFSISSTALSMLVISYTLQGESESKLIANEAVASMKAHNDELTGLLNRLAYIEKCEAANDKENVGVVFADVNGLKYANDFYGHKAGDALLCEFAGMLSKCFRKSEVFRVSGDEFVVLATDIPEHTFELKIKELYKLINEKEMPIAAIGYVYGSEGELSSLVERAETLMYVEKKIAHEKYPIYNRQ